MTRVTGWLTANKPVSELFYANGVLDFAGCGVVHMARDTSFTETAN